MILLFERNCTLGNIIKNSLEVDHFENRKRIQRALSCTYTEFCIYRDYGCLKISLHFITFSVRRQCLQAQSHREGWHSGNALDPYSKHVHFGSQSGHHMY
jgi:hypothetical protein